MKRTRQGYGMLLFSAVFIILGAVLTGCGGGGSGLYASPSGTPSGTTTSTVQVVACPASGTTDISIAGMAFNPASATIAVNGIMKWTNNDGVTHTVTSTTVPANGTFNETLTAGTSVCLKFTSAGTYQYHCSIHPSMTGTVTVQ